ncbi:MAG: copper chaperone PCu(A)C [Pseudomonadota bacterium]
MTRLLARLLFVSFTGFLSLGFAPQQAHAGGLMVADAWSPLAPPGVRVHAAYFTLMNHSGAERRLTGVSAEGYGGAALHETREFDGLAAMVSVAELALPPGATARFEPGGLHVMLLQPAGPQAEGGSVALSLHFANGETLDVAATIRRHTARSGHDHGAHHNMQHDNADGS